MNRVSWLVVFCATAVLSTTAAGPARADQAPLVRVPGAAVSALRGPTGFPDDVNQRGPSLLVDSISVRVELHPDLALVEQTYTITNADKATSATVGVRQRDHAYGEGHALQTYRPLAATAWLNGKRLAQESVTIHALPNQAPKGPGYEVALSTVFPAGQSELSLILAMQTVADVDVAGARQPAGDGDSHFALQFSHYSWDWAPGDEAPEPQTKAVITTAGGTPISGLIAEAWTDGAVRTADAFFWQRAPWFVLRYRSPKGIRRAATRDDLVRTARKLVRDRPLGHVLVPESAAAATRPGPGYGEPVIDPARARRALIVPLGALILLLLCGYFYGRRRRTE